MHSRQHWSLIRVATAAGLVALNAAAASAQTMDDALMLPAHQLRVTMDVGRDSWSQYWEGSLKRSNDNLGTLTTQSTMLGVSYGLTSRIDLFATMPYISTSASQGVLSGMKGRQDFTAGLKVSLLETALTQRGRLRVTAFAGGSVPTSRYTPDFQPLSIGLGSRRALFRGAMHYKDRSGLFADLSAGYQWRSNVTLDRPAYYTNGQLVLSDQVAMPSVTDWISSIGFQNSWLCLPISVVQQRTLGGGDIRRQDMPFVSNRMDFTKVQAMAMITLPGQRFILNLGASQTVQGRNVGQSSMVMGGVTYVIGR
jgi:hypothetical protein